MIEAYARHSDPETSHDAAASVQNCTVLETEVLRKLHGAPQGMTVDELTDATGLDKVTVSPRLKPLESKGLVVRVGTRKGKSGKKQTIWFAT